MTRGKLGTLFSSIAAAVFLVQATAIGDAFQWTGPTVPMEGTIRIATGPDSGLDGYLDVAPDNYGAWTVPFGGGPGPNDDHFNPLGAMGLLPVAFSSGMFLFVPNSGQRELLSDSADWQAVFGGDASLNRVVTSPLTAMDTSGNGVMDTLQSSFRVFGGATDLGFNLTQHVEMFAPGMSFIQQTYAITNNESSSVSFQMVRAFDGDLFWSGDFADDEVGTGFFGSGFDPYVYEQEVGDSRTAVTLSSPQGEFYYGGKQGMTPPNGPPAFGFGTDVQVWDAFGVPESWLNFIAGVGYDTNGASGPFPPGSTPPEDGFIGLNMSIFLSPGESTTINVFHTYGSNSPVPEPGAITMLLLGALSLACRRRRRI